MLILTVVSILTGITFAILYWRTRKRYQLFLKQYQVERIALQGEVDVLREKILLGGRDPITHLPGWQMFEDRVSQCIKECERYEFILGILVIDIDNFKVINSAIGYEDGDVLLKIIAERLQSCIRQVDSASRQGKDTFVVLLTQLSRQETAAIIIQRILQALTQPFNTNGNALSLTACVGAAFYPEDGVKREDLMQHAEHAMLLAKKKGKQAYQFYQENLQEDSQRELAMYNSLSSDVFLDEIKLFYQPVMDAQKNTHCVEVQLVWQHSQLGAIPGEELLAYAERQRKLDKITEQVLRDSCKKFQSWRGMGLKAELLAIPVLLNQLVNARFIYRLSQILSAAKIEPSSVLLEIRESSEPVSLDVLEKTFNMLRYLGFQIAIDHFGSGVFSLRYLKNMSLHFLKLDPALIIDIVENEQTRAIIQATVHFSSRLSLGIIATGVENDGQMQVLSSLGVSFMQGKLFGVPLSEAEMAGKMTGG